MDFTGLPAPDAGTTEKKLNHLDAIPTLSQLKLLMEEAMVEEQRTDETDYPVVFASERFPTGIPSATQLRILQAEEKKNPREESASEDENSVPQEDRTQPERKSRQPVAVRPAKRTGDSRTSPVRVKVSAPVKPAAPKAPPVTPEAKAETEPAAEAQKKTSAVIEEISVPTAEEWESIGSDELDALLAQLTAAQEALNRSEEQGKNEPADEAAEKNVSVPPVKVKPVKAPPIPPFPVSAESPSEAEDTAESEAPDADFDEETEEENPVSEENGGELIPSPEAETDTDDGAEEETPSETEPEETEQDEDKAPVYVGYSDDEFAERPDFSADRPSLVDLLRRRKQIREKKKEEARQRKKRGRRPALNASQAQSLKACPPRSRFKKASPAVTAPRQTNP